MSPLKSRLPENSWYRLVTSETSHDAMGPYLAFGLGRERLNPQHVFYFKFYAGDSAIFLAISRKQPTARVGLVDFRCKFVSIWGRFPISWRFRGLLGDRNFTMIFLLILVFFSFLAANTIASPKRPLNRQKNGNRDEFAPKSQ